MRTALSRPAFALLGALGAAAFFLTGCPEADPKLQCASDTDCFEDVGYVCDLLDKVCVPGCDSDGDCISGQSCEVDVERRAEGGVCIHGESGGGGDDMGDVDTGGDSGGDA